MLESLLLLRLELSSMDNQARLDPTIRKILKYIQFNLCACVICTCVQESMFLCAGEGVLLCHFPLSCSLK